MVLLLVLTVVVVVEIKRGVEDLKNILFKEKIDFKLSNYIKYNELIMEVTN